MLRTSSVYAETKIIPSVSLSERYDSNVYFAPKGLLPRDTREWDFVTTLAPRLDIRDKSREFDNNFSGGVTGNAFVNNPELNFVSTDLNGSSSWDGLIRQYVPGATLQVADSFSYTPEPPAFATGGKQVGAGNIFAQGIQATRANTYSNTATVTGSYPVAREILLRGDYTYSVFRVGQLYVTPTAGTPTAFFDTNLHRWSLGPSVRLSQRDTVGLNYQNTSMTLSGQGVNQNFEAHGVQAEYFTTASEWTARVSGGATILTQGNLAFWSGKLVLRTKQDRSTRYEVTLSRGIAPAFFATGGALISSTASISVEHDFSKVLKLTGNANYGLNEATPVKIATFESTTASVMLTYGFTKTELASLSYGYNDFKFGGASLETFAFSRHVVTFSLVAKWN